VQVAYRERPSQQASETYVHDKSFTGKPQVRDDVHTTLVLASSRQYAKMTISLEPSEGTGAPTVTLVSPGSCSSSY
jgi:hypothetical protein